MPITIQEGRLRFVFPNGWIAIKYDDTSFYRNQFQKVADSSKAIDIVALDPHSVLYLIEVKDYSVNPRTKPIELSVEVAQKVRDTLAGLVAQKANANDPSERQHASDVLQHHSLKVIAHVETPANPSRLWRNPINLQSLAMDLRGEMKAIDPHPFAMDKRGAANVAWTVS